jgi:TolA-binding protein
MTEPRRYSDDGGDRLGVALLRSARDDAPTASSRARALAAIAALGATGTATTTKAAVSVAAIGKLFLGVLAVSAVGTAVVVGARSSERSPAPHEMPAASASARTVAPVATVSAPPREDASSPTPVIPAPTAETSARKQPVAAGGSAVPPIASSSLADEVGALEGARAALARGDADAALRALDRYRATFPRGVLSQEATVLRVEALSRKGDRAAASDLARRFVDAHPESPTTERVRSLGGLSDDAPAPSGR